MSPSIGIAARLVGVRRARHLLPILLVMPLACQDSAASLPPGDPVASDIVGTEPGAPSLALRSGVGTGKPGTGATPSLTPPPTTNPPAVATPVPNASVLPPLPPLPEQDDAGAPVLYYGRVRITDRAQAKLLKVLGFVRDSRPFFDDYHPEEVRRGAALSSTEPLWMYAIASAQQWNFLRRYPGLVGEMEMNPRVEPGPHPALDSFLPAGPRGTSIRRKFTTRASSSRSCSCPRRAGLPRPIPLPSASTRRGSWVTFGMASPTFWATLRPRSASSWPRRRG
jgi:hypothetical protein